MRLSREGTGGTVYHIKLSLISNCIQIQTKKLLIVEPGDIKVQTKLYKKTTLWVQSVLFIYFPTLPNDT